MKNEKKDYTVAIIVCGIIVSLLAVILGPIFIDEAFQKTASNKWLAVDWESKDALNYYGTALAFLGTAVFSALALWQNHVIKTENDKYNRLKEKQEKEKNAPFFVVQSKGCWGHGQNLSISVENKSDNIAKDVSICNFRIVNNNGVIVWEDDRCFSRTVAIKGKPTEIYFNNDDIKDGETFLLDINYKDIFDNDYSIVLESISKWEHLPSFNIVKK